MVIAIRAPNSTAKEVSVSVEKTFLYFKVLFQLSKEAIDFVF